MFTRPDGRELNALRDITIERNYTKHAPGSVLICFGDTKVICTASIEERVPRHIHQNDIEDHGWLTAEYGMLPGATNTRFQRERQRVSGRTTEIQRLIGRCLRASVDLEKIGQRTITIDCDVIQADGGTRCASITGGFIALMDAMNWLKAEGKLDTIPLISPVAAVSVGVCENTEILDLNYDEDSSAEVDANVVMNKNGHIIEVQASSEKIPLTRPSLDKMIDLADEGIKELIAMQEAAIGIVEATV